MFWKRAAIVAIGAIAVIGLKIQQKNQFEAKLHAQLVALCAAERPCNQAVAKHFKPCFDRSYALGARYKQSGLNYENFLGCLNRESRTAYFELDNRPSRTHSLSVVK